jgi:hypothetical protein
VRYRGFRPFLGVLALAVVTALLSSQRAESADTTVTVINDAGNYAVTGRVIDDAPPYAKVALTNQHDFWTNITLQPPSGKVHLKAADPLQGGSDVGGFYAALGALGPGSEAVWGGDFDAAESSSEAVIATPSLAEGSLKAGALNILTFVSGAVGEAPSASNVNDVIDAVDLALRAPNIVDAINAVDAQDPRSFAMDVYGALSDTQQQQLLAEALGHLGVVVSSDTLKQLTVVYTIGQLTLMAGDEILALIQQTAAGKVTFQTVVAANTTPVSPPTSASPPTGANARSLKLSPSSGPSGATIKATGSGWKPNNPVVVLLDQPSLTENPLAAAATGGNGKVLSPKGTQSDATGNVNLTFKIPSGISEGVHNIYLAEVDAACPCIQNPTGSSFTVTAASSSSNSDDSSLLDAAVAGFKSSHPSAVVYESSKACAPSAAGCATANDSCPANASRCVGFSEVHFVGSTVAIAKGGGSDDLGGFRNGYSLFAYLFKDSDGWHYVNAMSTQNNGVIPLPGEMATVQTQPINKPRSPTACANLRQAPTTQADILRCLPDGTKVSLGNEPVYSEGRIWWQVTPNGWLAQDAFEGYADTY